MFVFTSEMILLGVVDRVDIKEAGEHVPALEIATLICVIWCVASSAVKVAGSVVVENGRMSKLLDSAFGSADRALVEVVGERMVAITVVLGRRRRARVRPRPIPVIVLVR